MSYQCSVCQGTVPRNISRRVHPVLRPNGDIERELPCCGACHALLSRGLALSVVRRQRHEPRRVKPTVPNPARPKLGRPRMLLTKEEIAARVKEQVHTPKLTVRRSGFTLAQIAAAKPAPKRLQSTASLAEVAVTEEGGTQ